MIMKNKNIFIFILIMVPKVQVYAPFVLVPIYRRPQASGHHGSYLALLLLIVVTSLKLIDFSVSVNIDSEVQDA